MQGLSGSALLSLAVGLGKQHTQAIELTKTKGSTNLMRSENSVSGQGHHGLTDSESSFIQMAQQIKSNSEGINRIQTAKTNDKMKQDLPGNSKGKSLRDNYHKNLTKTF